ncbi:MAG: tetratricopeptide repeat protein [Myxococcaceae bacterium]
MTSEDHDQLFRRGANLIEPHMLLDDQKPASPNEHEVRVGIACLDRVVTINPSNWSALWIRGKAFQSLGDHSSALGSFRSAYRVKPGQEDVAREMTRELLELRQFAEAVTIGRDICKRNPDDAGLRANLALALLLNGELADAQQVIGSAQKLDPNDAVTNALAKRIDEVANGKRPQPSTLDELQRGR